MFSEDPFFFLAHRNGHGPTASLVLRDTAVGLPSPVHFERVDWSISPFCFVQRDGIVT